LAGRVAGSGFLEFAGFADGGGFEIGLVVVGVEERAEFFGRFGFEDLSLGICGRLGV
jgi:hypothetical protein